MSELSLLSGRPLLATTADAALFVDRATELSALDTAVDAGLNAILIGTPGSGKTSTLHQLERRLHAEGRRNVAFIEGAATDEIEAFVELVAHRLGRLPATPVVARSVGTTARVLDLLAAIGESGAGDRLLDVVLVDSMSADVARSLFARMRDEVWQLPVRWVVTATDTDAMRFLAPPADAFFETVVRLAPLTERSSRALVRARLGRRVPRAAVDRIVEVGAGNPRRILDAARDVIVEGVAPEVLANRSTRRTKRLASLGDAPARLVEWLDGNGAVSASDPALQRHLGVGRSRATQLLKELEERAVVESASAPDRPGAGPGRNRKLYRLRPVEEWR